MTDKKRTWFYWVKRVLLILFLGQLVYLLLVKWIDPPITITQIMNLNEGSAFRRDYIAYDEMGSNIKLAVMASEDQLFPDHNGFDLESIKKAMQHNERHPNRVRGASTISQQTAKNVFLWQKGGYFRKGLEVYFTWMIELIWGKKRILETYLNVAEMGPGIFGVQAASRFYFKKDARDLSRKEAAQIAACLPNPKRFIVAPPGRYVARRTSKIMQQMSNLETDVKVRSLVFDR